jgi:hypothetical protein
MRLPSKSILNRIGRVPERRLGGAYSCSRRTLLNPAVVTRYLSHRLSRVAPRAAHRLRLVLPTVFVDIKCRASFDMISHGSVQYLSTKPWVSEVRMRATKRWPNALGTYRR